MARSRGVWRFCFGWCLLLCVLPTVEAGTVKVNVPSLASQVQNGAASFVDSKLTFSTAIDGEFIPGPTKNVPVRGILGQAEFGLSTIVPKTKSLIKGGLVGIAVGFAFEELLDGLNWVMKDGTVVKKLPSGPAVYVPKGNEYYWNGGSSPNFSSASAVCDWTSTNIAVGFPDKQVNLSVTGGSAFCSITSSDWHSTSLTITRFGGQCPTGFNYDVSSGSCSDPSAPSTTAPLVDKDFVTMEDLMKMESTDWFKDLLKQQCNGSIAPTRCYQELLTAPSRLKGPATVDAGTVTTTTTHKNADGTTSTTAASTKTTYNITYGDNNFNYNKHTSTTTTTNGVPGDTTETDEQPSDEADPDDTQETPDDNKEPEIKPSPCSGDSCDGPAYIKLYEPIKETKETFIDSYVSSVKQLPLMSAVGGFFNVNASAGCPVWSASVNFSVFAASFATDLVFDFHCQGWFVSVASYAKYVMAIVCSFLAFRQAFLD